MTLLESIKDYLRIDGDYDDNLIEDLIEISQIYIDSMVGEAYKKDEKAIKLARILQKKIITDMYENRTTIINVNMKQDKIMTSILNTLALRGVKNDKS